MLINLEGLKETMTYLNHHGRSPEGVLKLDHVGYEV